MEWIKMPSNGDTSHITTFSSINCNDCEPEATSDPRILELLWATQISQFRLKGRDICEGKIDHGEIAVVAVVKGSLLAETTHIQGNVNSGHVFFTTPSDSNCRLTAHNTCSCIALTLCGKLLQVLEGHFLQGKVFCPKGLPELLKTVTAVEGKEARQTAISVSLYRLLMYLYESAQKYEDDGGHTVLVDAALGIIQEEFAFLDGVDEVARRLEVTPNHLIREFSRAIGISPGQYLKIRRIDNAKYLLEKEGMSVALASDLSGFSSPNYFAKVFRKETGMSPHEYALSHSSEAEDDKTARRLLNQAIL